MLPSLNEEGNIGEYDGEGGEVSQLMGIASWANPSPRPRADWFRVCLGVSLAALSV